MHSQSSTGRLHVEQMVFSLSPFSWTVGVTAGPAGLKSQKDLELALGACDKRNKLLRLAQYKRFMGNSCVAFHCITDCNSCITDCNNLEYRCSSCRQHFVIFLPNGLECIFKMSPV